MKIPGHPSTVLLEPCQGVRGLRCSSNLHGDWAKSKATLLETVLLFSQMQPGV